MSASPELSLATPEIDIRAIAIRQAPMDSQEEGGEGCRTPTAEESKLPSAPGTCPPAPRKKPRVLSCKRRLQYCSDVDRLIVVSAKEMEDMFQHAKKRRRSLHSIAK